MTKLTSRDLSPADFEAWHDVPWFLTFLRNEIEFAEEALAVLGDEALHGEFTRVDTVRHEAAAMAGRKSALETLLELEYTEVVEEEDES